MISQDKAFKDLMAFAKLMNRQPTINNTGDIYFFAWENNTIKMTITNNQISFTSKVYDQEKTNSTTNNTKTLYEIKDLLAQSPKITNEMHLNMQIERKRSKLDPNERSYIENFMENNKHITKLMRLNVDDHQPLYELLISIKNKIFTTIVVKKNENDFNTRLHLNHNEPSITFTTTNYTEAFNQAQEWINTYTINDSFMFGEINTQFIALINKTKTLNYETKIELHNNYRNIFKIITKNEIKSIIITKHTNENFEANLYDNLTNPEDPIKHITSKDISTIIKTILSWLK